MKAKIKYLHENAKMPEKAHLTDFGYDCYAVTEEEVAPGVWKYGLGIAVQADLDPKIINVGFTLRPRSSIYKTGMVMANSIGTVDKNYTGELCVVMYHVMPNMPRYKVGDKICQMHFDSANPILFEIVEELEDTDRGEGGFGSTDKQ